MSLHNHTRGQQRFKPAYFNGSIGHRSTNNATLYNGSGGSDMTWSAWFYPTDDSGGYQIIFGIDRTSSFMRFEGIAIHPNGYISWASTFGSDTFVSIGDNFSYNRWNHIACRRVGANGAFLVEGWLNGRYTANFVQAEDKTTHFWFIGAKRLGDGTGFGDYFNGMITAAAVWNTRLSPFEINRLYRGASPAHVRSANLHEYWPLNGDANSTVGSHNIDVDV